MRHASPWFCLMLSACTSAVRPGQSAPVVSQGVEITAAELRRDLYAFADDSMRGRETGTADATRAARFLATRVQSLGLEPAGDSLYLQRVPLQREEFTAATRFVVREGDRSTTLRVGTDVVPLLNLGAGVPPTKRSADGDIVFAGYGMPIAALKRDDLAGLDLRGRVVVVVNGAPAGVDSATRERLESQAAISERLARILPQGPAAVIILMTGKGSELFQQVAPQMERSVSARSTGPELSDADRPIPMILLGVPLAGSPLLPRGWPADDRPQLLRGRQFSARVEQQRTPIVAYNVVAMVRGSDPLLSRTYVALGAHYDHVGVSAPINGDSISNGADDDGSGTVALLAIASAIQKSPVKPKRSVLFVWHTGEEKGLLGSEYFVGHPTVPIDSVVAQLNADMIGRNAASLLYTVGPLSAPGQLSRRLGAIVDSVNASQPMPFAIDRSFDSPTHPEHIYERSDHISYARKGIPIVFFTTGLHDDYHKPSDEPGKIDYEKLSRVARLIRDAATAVANSSSRPR